MFYLFKLFKNQKLLFKISILIFLLVNFGAIFFSWEGRDLPPEPDDTSTMIFYIKSNKDYSSTFSNKLKIFNRLYYWTTDNGLDRLNFFSWSFLWGKTAKFFSISPVTALKISFYFGIVLFLSSSLYFFKEKNIVFKIILVLTLTFFTGDGTYHGLFWPAPSLYSASIFLLITKILFDKNKSFVKLALILPAYLMLHPLSQIALFSLPIFVFLNLIFKNKTYYQKIFIVFFSSLIFYFILFKTLSFLNIETLRNTNLIGAVLINLLHGKLSLSMQSSPIIFDKYFLYILTRPLFLTLFILGLLKLIKNDIKAVFIYFSLLSLLLIGLFFNGGERILLNVWIFTFFILSFGLFYLFSLIKNLYYKPNFAASKKLLFLILLNMFIELIFAIFVLKVDCVKNLILKGFFIWSNILILILLFIGWLLKRRASLLLIIFSVLNFFIYLSLEKAAMVIFLKQNKDIAFSSKIFINSIKKEGLIIYNDNLSFAVFSSHGMLEREVAKKGALQKDDLAKAAYFIAQSYQFECREDKCLFEERGQKKIMKKIASDNNFLLYEF